MSVKLISRGVREAQDDWREQQQCVIEGIPTSAFYPEQYQSLDEAVGAIECCIGRCAVREHCLQYALDNGEKFGYWGGVSERQRREIKRNGFSAAEAIAKGMAAKPRRGRPPNGSVS